MSQELRNRERRNNNSRLYLNRGYNPNVCRLYNKYYSVPLVSLVLVSFFLCADTTWWLSWDPYAPPFSPVDEATTSRKQLDPLPSQLSHKKEKRKKKEEKKNTRRRDSHTGNFSHPSTWSSQKPVGFCTEIGQWYGFGPGQHQGHSCLAQDDDLIEQSGLGLHSCNTRGSLYHYRSWMLHRVNGSNRELEQNPTRHSWSFSKITPDDWR